MPSPIKSVLIVLALLVSIALVAAPLSTETFVATISSHAGDFLLATMAAVPAAEAELVGVYTIVEFAAAFKISRAMVYKLERTGRLKIAKIGARSVVTHREARRFQRKLESSDAAA